MHALDPGAMNAERLINQANAVHALQHARTREEGENIVRAIFRSARADRFTVSLMNGARKAHCEPCE